MNTGEFQSLFQTPEQRAKALNDLEALRHHPGWHLIVQMYNLLIADREQQILEDEEMTEAQRKDLKIQRKDFVFGRDLPEDTIKALMEDTQREEHTDDPFE